jgi:hypothetical protein
MARIEQGRADRRAELDAAARASAVGAAGPDGAPAIGARVFDPLTGQYGEVVAHGSENVVVPDPAR